MLPVRLLPGAFLLLSFFPSFGSATHAADLTVEPVVVIEESAPRQWEVQTTLYLWATALEGSIGIGNLPNANIDATFGDILENLDGAVMGNVAVSNGTWLLLADLVWSKMSDQTNLNVLNSPTLKFEQSLLIASAIGGYGLPFGIDALDVYVTAGLRYQNLSADTSLISGTYPLEVNRSRTEDWLDPIVGVAVQYGFNDRWRLNGIADIGGFGVGSQLTAQGFLTLSYNWTDHFSTAAGYRAIYTNYESGSGSDRFDYEATLHGPFLSAAFHF